MSKKVEPNAEEQQKHLVNLVNRCLVFTDRKGKVLAKEGTPVTSLLEMKYQGDNLLIKFFASNAAMGNGVCRISVKYKGELVLAAKGRYSIAAYDIEARIYIPGEWEKKIPESSRN